MKTNIKEAELRKLLLNHTEVETAKILGVSRSTVIRAKKIYNIQKSYTELLQNIEMTEEEKQIVYGTLLGDGHLSIIKERPFLRVEHGAKQKEYAEWKYKKLENLTTKKGVIKSNRDSYYFGTRCIGDLEYFYKLFYTPEGVKRLPQDFEAFINPLSLAVWFLDDGTNAERQTKAELIVQGYTSFDIGRMIATFRLKFGVECNLVKRFEKKYNKVTENIAFTKEGTIKLLDLIRLCVEEIEVMRYKLYPRRDYVRTPKE